MDNATIIRALAGERDMWGAPLRHKLPPVQDDHCIRRAYHDVRARLDRGGYSSADEYHDDKDRARQLAARMHTMTEMQYDPMGFWFGRQSN